MNPILQGSSNEDGKPGGNTKENGQTYWPSGKLFPSPIPRRVEIKSANHDLTCNILFYDNVNNDIIMMIIIESMK